MWTKPFTRCEELTFFCEFADIFTNRILDRALRESLQGAIKALLEERDVAPISSVVLDYETITECDAIAARQVLALFQKNSSFVCPDARLEDEAYAKFRDAEAQCRLTNTRFSSPVPAVDQHLIPSLFRARRLMARLLGPCPRVDELPLRFGPGSTSTVAKKNSNPQVKLGELPSCSESLLRSSYFNDVVRSMPHWLDCHGIRSHIDEEGYEVITLNVNIEASRLEFVPKSLTSLRSIMTQPTLNTLFQCGIGDFMANRLKRQGIDLTDQTIQQRRAREGSLHGGFATIDLSSASDTIARQLVRFLLPSEWYSLLSAGCSRTYTYQNGEEHQLQHFSSMGNGFTFPLESAIFWCLCQSVSSHGSVTVFGDDIICRTKDVLPILEMLQYAGFTVNAKKSHLSGPFRESCGADYLRGIDIRPCYVKETLSDKVLYTIHNFFFGNYDGEAASCILRHIQGKKLIGPPAYGDGHLHSHSWDGFRTRQARRNGYGGVFFKTFHLKGLALPSIYPGDYVTPLYLAYRRGTPHGDVWYQVEDVRLKYLKDGRYLLDIPCVDGYEELSIYTFS